MEVSGIEGSCRDTCKHTMTLLCNNQDSLVAMLEAFVYDRLICWRLLLGQILTNKGEGAQPYNINDGTHHAQGFQKKYNTMSVPLLFDIPVTITQASSLFFLFQSILHLQICC